MSPSVTNPHDKTFKLLFKEKEIAQDVMRVNLPDEIVTELDFDSLALVDGSFVSSELEETFSDVLYQIRYGVNDLYVCLLFEHKSVPDKFASLQIGKYIYEIWEGHLRKRNEFPIVVPIVFYHGLAPWNYETDMRQLIPGYNELPEYFKQRLPAIMHDLIDMRLQDEELLRLYEPLTQLAVTSFKINFYDVEELIEIFFNLLEELRGMLSEDKLAYYIEVILLYFESGNHEFTESLVQRKINELEGKGELVMNILERREKRGMERGIKDNKRENAYKFLKLGVDVETVAEGTGLSIELIREMKEEINGESE